VNIPCVNYQVTKISIKLKIKLTFDVGNKKHIHFSSYFMAQNCLMLWNFESKLALLTNIWRFTHAKHELDWGCNNDVSWVQQIRKIYNIIIIYSITFCIVNHKEWISIIILTWNLKLEGEFHWISEGFKWWI
jgi:hypothetical protein